MFLLHLGLFIQGLPLTGQNCLCGWEIKYFNWTQCYLEWNVHFSGKDKDKIEGMHAHLCSTLCDHVDASVLSHQALSVGLSRQEYWNGLPFPPPGDLPNSGIEPESPAW